MPSQGGTSTSTPKDLRKSPVAAPRSHFRAKATHQRLHSYNHSIRAVIFIAIITSMSRFYKCHFLQQSLLTFPFQDLYFPGKWQEGKKKRKRSCMCFLFLPVFQGKSPKTSSLPRRAGAGIKYCCICLGGQGRWYRKRLAVRLQEAEGQRASCTGTQTRALRIEVKARHRMRPPGQGLAGLGVSCELSCQRQHSMPARSCHLHGHELPVASPAPWGAHPSLSASPHGMLRERGCNGMVKWSQVYGRQS